MTTTVIATPSKMPYVALAGIAFAIAWGSSRRGSPPRSSPKRISLSHQQHRAGRSLGVRRIVSGVGIGIWLSQPWMARWAEGAIQTVQPVHVDPHANWR
jgi:hypothetical protein